MKSYPRIIFLAAQLGVIGITIYDGLGCNTSNHASSLENDGMMVDERVADDLTPAESSIHPSNDFEIIDQTLQELGEDMGLDLNGVDLNGPITTCQPTQSDALGPYYKAGAPFKTNIAEDEPGQRLLIYGKVSGCTAPVPNPIIDVWQADASGQYPSVNDGYRLRGKVQAQADGTYQFHTVLPGSYDKRPRHIHLIVTSPTTQSLTTQVYFANDPFLGPNDSCQPPTCYSDDPLRTIELTEKNVDGQIILFGQFNAFLSLK